MNYIIRLKCIIHVSYVIWEGWPGWPGWPELTGVAGGLGGVAWGGQRGGGWPKGWRVAEGMARVAVWIVGFLVLSMLM